VVVVDGIATGSHSRDPQLSMTSPRPVH